MGKIVKSVLGGLTGSAPKPRVQEAVADTADAQRKAKASRSALFETAGGVTGEELNPDDVKKRSTLFGN